MTDSAMLNLQICQALGLNVDQSIVSVTLKIRPGKTPIIKAKIRKAATWGSDGIVLQKFRLVPLEEMSA